MSDANAQEPTMEEILASIRRIISEDDAPAADAAPAEAAEAPEAEAAPAEAAAPEPIEIDAEFEEEDVLELTERVSPPPAAARAIGDLDVFSRDDQPAPAAGAAGFEPDEEPEDEGLVSPRAADRASSYFGSLSRSLAMPGEGRTLEDLVSELIRPMLKEWLDAHLPSIVEAKVQAEVERVSRNRR